MGIFNIFGSKENDKNLNIINNETNDLSHYDDNILKEEKKHRFILKIVYNMLLGD